MLAKILLSAVAVAALVTLACGGGGPKNKVTIDVKAQNTRFQPETIEVPAGQTVTLRLVNLDSTDHDLEVRGLVPSTRKGGGHGGHGGHGAGQSKNLAVHAGARRTASVEFRADQPGTYEVVCTIPGHEASGMVAKLVVV